LREADHRSEDAVKFEEGSKEVDESQVLQSNISRRMAVRSSSLWIFP
jgi:hypothetical protein